MVVHLEQMVELPLLWDILLRAEAGELAQVGEMVGAGVVGTVLVLVEMGTMVAAVVLEIKEHQPEKTAEMAELMAEVAAALDMEVVVREELTGEMEEVQVVQRDLLAL